MNPTEHTLWVVAIIVGFVVVLAVAALLSLLIYLIKVIDKRVLTIGGTLTAAKANTASTALTRSWPRACSTTCSSAA